MEALDEEMLKLDCLK